MKKSIIFFSIAATVLLSIGLFAAKPLSASTNEGALETISADNDRVTCSDGVCVIQDAKKRSGNGCKDRDSYWCVVGKAQVQIDEGTTEFHIF